MESLVGPDLALWQIGAVIVVAILGGLVRGLTGFGGALVMTVPLAMAIGPQRAVLTVVLLEAVASVTMLRDALGAANLRVVAPIALASCLTVPLGGYLLLTADAQVLRQLMAGIVIIFSLMLLRGMRYSGAQRLGTSVLIGAASGLLLGATSMGGPPVILYVLSGPDPARVNRANLNLCVGAMTGAGVVMLSVSGIMSVQGALGALLLAPCFLAGVRLGIRFFPRLDEQLFRRVTLVLLASVSALSLLV